MSRTLVCGCGEPLYDPAGAGTGNCRCPRCGALVPLQPPNGTGSCLVAGSSGVPAIVLTLPTDPSLQPCRHVQERWYEFVLYPVLAWRICLGLAILSTAFTALVILNLPSFLADLPATSEGVAVGTLMGLVVVVVLLGLPGSFLQCALSTAAGGLLHSFRWSGNPVTLILKTGLLWLACFLPGPGLFALAAWYYWLSLGEVEPLDGLILAQLGLVAVTCWIYVLLTAADGARLRLLDPRASVDLAHRLGWRGLVGCPLLAGVFLLHGAGMLFGVIQLHEDLLSGLFLLFAVWGSGIFWGACFFRMLGAWCHQTHPTSGLR